MAAHPPQIVRRGPTAVGRYDLDERIGKGGMGAVYRGRDRETGAVVAVKILGRALAGDPQTLARFAQEFTAAQKLDHPNIVRCLDAGADGESHYFVMEYVEGLSLGDAVRKNGKMSERTAVRVITQMAQALHYAHRRKVIHRDVKPENVLVRADGLAKLADFGLAKDTDSDGDLTRSATLLGTPHYMAPEQYTDAKRVGPAVDVYSLAATLYTALTGRLPFADCKTVVALAKQTRLAVPSPRQVVPAVSEAVDRAVRLAMHPDPAQRPATCLEFARLLPAADPTQAEVETPRDRKSERRRSPRRPAVQGAACLVDTGITPGETDAVEAWPAAVRDLSASGVGLVLARRFEPGTQFGLDLETSIRKGSRPAARVIWVRADGYGCWLHGCEFLAARRAAGG
jgi:serine/threonine protein kinase